MLRHRIAGVLAAAALLLCFPRPGTGQSRARIDYESYELDNGLRVIIAEDHSTPVTAVDVWYHVGSRHDPEGRSGFAHLFEHMMFQGSAHAGETE